MWRLAYSMIAIECDEEAMKKLHLFFVKIENYKKENLVSSTKSLTL
jgi:hypothetical protein